MIMEPKFLLWDDVEKRFAQPEDHVEVSWDGVTGGLTFKLLPATKGMDCFTVSKARELRPYQRIGLIDIDGNPIFDGHIITDVDGDEYTVELNNKLFNRWVAVQENSPVKLVLFQDRVKYYRFKITGHMATRGEHDDHSNS